MKSADGGIEYQNDTEFLRKCFIWSCLTNKSNCISNQNITNQLCLYQDTNADIILKKMGLDDTDKNLLLTWNKLLMKIKEKEEYISYYKYGLSQIEKEINIDISSGRKDKTGKMIMIKKYNNSGDVDDLIKQLKKQLVEYRNDFIDKKLFQYQLLK